MSSQRFYAVIRWELLACTEHSQQLGTLMSLSQALALPLGFIGANQRSVLASCPQLRFPIHLNRKVAAQKKMAPGGSKGFRSR